MLMCLSHTVTLASNLDSFVMTFAACHGPAVQSFVQACFSNISAIVIIRNMTATCQSAFHISS